MVNNELWTRTAHFSTLADTWICSGSFSFPKTPAPGWIIVCIININHSLNSTNICQVLCMWNSLKASRTTKISKIYFQLLDSHYKDCSKRKEKPENDNRTKIKYFLENNVLIFVCLTLALSYLCLLACKFLAYKGERVNALQIKCLTAFGLSSQHIISNRSKCLDFSWTVEVWLLFPALDVFFGGGE